MFENRDERYLDGHSPSRKGSALWAAVDRSRGPPGTSAWTFICPIGECSY